MYPRPTTTCYRGHGLASPTGVPIGGPFHLIGQQGPRGHRCRLSRPVDAVFFGYTDCPDECPLTLQKMANALDALGPLADRIARLFITVDPTRDTPASSPSILRTSAPRIVGLTGSDEQIAGAAKAYHVYYSPAEHEQSGADLVSHSTFVYLINPRGKLDALFSQDIDADALAATLRARLSPQNAGQAEEREQTR